MNHIVKLLTLACLVAAGCEAPPAKVAVAIASPELTSLHGTFAPTVPIRGTDGRVTTLQASAAPAYVVAFVPAGDSGGCAIDPRLSTLANQLWKESVSVIQITQPSPQVFFSVTGPIPCPPPPGNGMLVLDPDRIAWCAFGSPSLGTVLLIDPRGEIVGESDLDNLDNIRWCADYLSEENRHTLEFLIFTGQTNGRVGSGLDWY